MKKIIVIGCPGSGKSTFARELHRITGLPLCHLDLLYWNADRTTVEKPVFRERLGRVLAEDAWIIDGNYQSTLEMRMEACDTVIFLDYATDVCLAGIRERRGKPRPDIPWIEDGEDEEFVRFVKDYNAENRPHVLALLEKYAEKRIVILRDRAEGERFLLLCGEKD